MLECNSCSVKKSRIFKTFTQQVSCSFLSTEQCDLLICGNQVHATDVVEKDDIEVSIEASSLAPVLPVSTVDPCHTDRLKDDNDHQWQSGRIIIEHGHKVVPAALSEEQTSQEAQDTAHH